MTVDDALALLRELLKAEAVAEVLERIKGAAAPRTSVKRKPKRSALGVKERIAARTRRRKQGPRHCGKCGSIEHDARNHSDVGPVHNEAPRRLKPKPGALTGPERRAAIMAANERRLAGG